VDELQAAMIVVPSAVFYQPKFTCAKSPVAFWLARE
jgi:hypothetical protein